MLPLIIATILFFASVFGPVVCLYWYLDRVNDRRGKADSRAHLLSCLIRVECYAACTDRAFLRGSQELVREADRSALADMLEKAVSLETMCRNSLQDALDNSSCNSLLEARIFADGLDKTGISHVDKTVCEMEGLCDRRRGELVAVEHALHALPAVLASYQERIGALWVRERTIGDTHLDKMERVSLRAGISDAVGDQAHAAYFLEKLQEAVFAGGTRSPEAAHAAIHARKATDQCFDAIVRAQTFLDSAGSAAHGPPPRLSQAREKLEKLRSFARNGMSAAIIEQADRWLVSAAAHAATSRPYEIRRANEHIDRAMQLIRSAQLRM